MFSIIMPMDDNRLEQFTVTKRVYDEFHQKKEFVIPTRTYNIIYPYLKKHKLLKDVRLIPYTIDGQFNPSKCMNIGVRESKYDHLIVTGPEVKPTTDILTQLSEVIDQNIVCQTWDQDIDGNLTSLVNNSYRNWSPQAYFLALFQKSDIEKINGWDEDFMDGYAWEDNDFGSRWVRAGIPFTIREDITATHLYHPRSETSPGGYGRNHDLFKRNEGQGIVRPKNGLVKE